MYLFTAGRAILNKVRATGEKYAHQSGRLINRISTPFSSVRRGSLLRRAERWKRHCIPLTAPNLRGGMGVISHAPPIPQGAPPPTDTVWVTAMKAYSAGSGECAGVNALDACSA